MFIEVISSKYCLLLFSDIIIQASSSYSDMKFHNEIYWRSN